MKRDRTSAIPAIVGRSPDNTSSINCCELYMPSSMFSMGGRGGNLGYKCAVVASYAPSLPPLESRDSTFFV